jgi:heat shock transcription factor
MTTNLNAIAGPSKLPPSPLVEIESPTQSLDSPGREAHRGLTQEPTVSRPGLSVDENGEIIKVPAFLNKLFRSVLWYAWDGWD